MEAEDGNDDLSNLSHKLLELNCSHILLGDCIRLKTDVDMTENSSCDPFQFRLAIERCKHVIVATCNLDHFEKELILCLRELGLSHLLDSLMIREVPPLQVKDPDDLYDPFVILRPELEPLVYEQLRYAYANYDLINLLSDTTETEIDFTKECLSVRNTGSFSLNDAIKVWNFLRRAPAKKIPTMQRPPEEVLYTSGMGVLIAVVQGDLSEEEIRGYDGIRWNAKMNGVKAQTKSFVNRASVDVDGELFKDQNGDLQIYQWRSTINSTRRLTKKVFFLRDVTRLNNIPEALVVYQYAYSTLYDDCPKPEPHGNNKSGQITKNLSTHEKTLALQLLQRGKSHKDVIAHLKPGTAEYQIQYLASKNNLTKKYGMYRCDPDEIAKQVLALSSEEFPVRVGHFLEVDKDGKRKIVNVLTFVNREYLKHVLHSCPNEGEIIKRKENIKMKVKELGGLAFVTEELHRNADNSGIDKNLGGHLMYDTTFNLSGFWISFLICDSLYFVTKDSGKRHRNVVAWMLHNSKSEQTHQSLFKHFNEECIRLKAKKRFTSLTTDAEAAFDGLKKNEVFHEGTHLLCDLHFLGNITSDSNRQGELKNILFGYTDKNTKEFVAGVLLKHTTYKNIIGEILMLRNAGNIRESESTKLCKNRNLLRHALVSRLYTGHSLPFVTTNSIEGFHSNLKKSFGGHRRSVIQLAKDSLHYVKMEMKHLRMAAAGDNNPYVRLNYPVGFGKSVAEMKTHYDNICFYPERSRSNFENPVDERLFLDLPEVKRNEIFQYCDTLSVVFFNDSQLEACIRPINDPSTVVTMIVVDPQSLVCICNPVSRVRCASSICSHVLAFFSRMTAPTRDKIMDATFCHSNIFPNPVNQYSGTKGRKIPSSKGVLNHSRTVHLGIVKEELSDGDEDDYCEVPAVNNVSSSSLKDLDISAHEEDRPLPPQKMPRKRKQNSRYDLETFDTETIPQPKKAKFTITNETDKAKKPTSKKKKKPNKTA